MNHKVYFQRHLVSTGFWKTWLKCAVQLLHAPWMDGLYCSNTGNPLKLTIQAHNETIHHGSCAKCNKTMKLIFVLKS